MNFDRLLAILACLAVTLGVCFYLAPNKSSKASSFQEVPPNKTLSEQPGNTVSTLEKPVVDQRVFEITRDLEKGPSKVPVTILRSPNGKRYHLNVNPALDLALPLKKGLDLDAFDFGEEDASLQLGDNNFALGMEIVDDAENGPMLVLHPLSMLAYNGVYRLSMSAKLQSLLEEEKGDDLVLLMEGRGSTAGAITDFDRDGDDDVIYCEYQELIGLTENDAQFSQRFKNTVLERAHQNYRYMDLDVADLNEDGLPDIVLANFADASGDAMTRVLLNRSTFGDQGKTLAVADETGRAFIRSQNQGSGVDLQLADIDKDGDLDILVADFDMGLRLFINQGRLQGRSSGDFVEARGGRHLRYTGALPEHATSVSTADIDKDGDLDVFLTRAYRQDILLINHLDRKNRGAFELVEESWRLPILEDNSSSAAFGDVDLDGDDDLVIGVLGGYNRLLLNQGNLKTGTGDLLGVFAEASEEMIPEFQIHRDYTTDVSLAQISRRGRLDILVTNLAVEEDRPSRIANRVYLNLGNGCFSARELASDERDGGSLGIATGELDSPADGLPDLYIFNNGPNLHLYTESTSIVSAPNSESKARFNALAADQADLPAGFSAWAQGDFDGDADEDFLFANTKGEFVYMENLGRNRFNPVTYTISLADEANALCVNALVAADFDKDGDLDVFAATGNLGLNLPQANMILVNDGSGFRESAVKSGIVRGSMSRSITTSVKAVDLDMDNDLDLTLLSSGRLEVFLNPFQVDKEFSWNFEEYKGNFDSQSGEYLLVADFTGNGRKDVALAGGRQIHFFANTGKPGALSLQFACTIQREKSMEYAEAVDYDGDGAVEIFLVENGSMVLLENRVRLQKLEEDSFQEHDLFVKLERNPEPGAKISSLVFADFDHDGDQDLIIHGMDSEESRLFINDSAMRFSSKDLAGGFLEASKTFANSSANFQNAKFIIPADLNGDSDLDVLLINAEGRLRVLENVSP